MPRVFLTAAYLLTVFFLMSSASASAADIPRMSTTSLKDRLDEENVIILDVRSGRDWRSSAHKIRGARRAAPRDFSNWVKTVPSGSTIVLYCA